MLGKRIKTCRLNAKLSQEQVAERLGVTRQAVTKWESGQSAPSTENLFRLAELFGTTVDLLLGGEPPAPEAEPLDEQEIIRRYIEKRENEKAARREKRKRKFLKALPKLIAAFILMIVLGILGYMTERWFAIRNDDMLHYALMEIETGRFEPDIYISEYSGIEYHTYNFPGDNTFGIAYYEDYVSFLVVDRDLQTMKEYRNGILCGTLDMRTTELLNLAYSMKTVRTVEECERIEELIADGDYETIEQEYDGEVIFTKYGVFVD